MPDRLPLQFFTIVAQNYLAHAFVLGESVLQNHPEAAFSVFLMDDPGRRWTASIESMGFGVIHPEDVSFVNYRKLVFQYDVTEASTSVKASIIQCLFDRGAQKVIYLDPDILCFRRFDEVLEALDQYCIVLTPHICSPVPEDTFPGERAIMASGIFNLGFIALSRSDDAATFVKWWARHLRNECVAEPDAGLFVDQKWVDMVPTCFDRVFITRHPAYNIAYWNLHERLLEERDGVLYEAQSGARVAFIHFSGIAVEDLNSICKYVMRNPLSKSRHKRRYTLDERPDLVGPFRVYEQLLVSAGIQRFSRIPYGYNTYDNGEPISKLERSLYLSSLSWQESSIDPFSSGHGSFRNACRRAGIRAGVVAGVKYSAQETIDRYRIHMRIVEFILRCCLRVLGPQRYLEFAKYMRHQFLPSNHLFLLKESRIAGTPDSSGVSSLEQRGNGKVLCDILKP